MRFDGLIQGTLLRRYKRFLADIELPGGEQITAHCPNTGAMTGCAEPGSPVWLSISDSKTRKYPHTWELVDTSTGMACIHAARANKIVHEAFTSCVVSGFDEYPQIATEVKYGKNSRVDLLLSGDRGRVFVEVKSVTLCRKDGWGLFPDAVSDRGRKHLLELAEVAKEPDTRAVMFYCALHNGVEQVAAAGDIDPRYRETLEQVMEQGVEVMAWRADVGPEGIVLTQALPFALDAPG
ncbi:MAG: sugar fermentation stimulation protein A [Bacteroidia bacterium]|jgi:sugar fermentation stimulation protein A